MPKPWEVALEKEFAAFRRLEESIPKWMVNAKADVSADQKALALSGAAWLTQAIKTYKAIGVLCRDGFGEDALSLLRGLFDILLNLVYLHVPSDERKRRLLDYIVLQREESLRLFREVPPEDPTIERWAEKQTYEVRAAVEEIAKRRSRKEVKALRRDWRHQSALQIAKDNGLLSAYDRIYRSGSQGLHGANVTHWLTEGPGGSLKMETEPSESWVGTVIQVAPRLMLDILRQANDLLNLKLSLPPVKARDDKKLE